MKEKPLWWKSGVFYQIYPQSFKDSNGDGIGDLNGIIEKLDYLAGLGIDCIWLSPVYQSPMADAGYDISDYRSIDPFFGTMKDFDLLLKEAHKKKIKIIMDLVINHTSNLHPWFIESRLSRNNPRRDWYIWHSGINGKPPNNWQGVFGGRAWEWDRKTKQFYLHSFLKEQPDLNWRNPAVKAAVFKGIKFWLDKGVDGFRLDVVNCYFKDAQFRNNPFGLGPNLRPYDLQKHLYERDRPEMHPLLKELRKLINSYKDRVLVGEVMAESPGDPAMAAGYLGKGSDKLHMSFDFSQVFMKWNARKILNTIRTWYDATPAGGWPALAFSSHDQPRSFSRFSKGKDSISRAKAAAVLLLTLRGTPFIYYGEEIGMRNGIIKRHEIEDPIGLHYWPVNKGRDGERTPMQWSNKKNAGFSEAKPWLKVNPEYPETNAGSEEKNPSSLLNVYKKLIALRKQNPALHSGDWEQIKTGPAIIAYFRSSGVQKMIIAVNLSNKKRFFKINDGERWKLIFSTHIRKESVIKNTAGLQPYEALILEKILFKRF